MRRALLVLSFLAGYLCSGSLLFAQQQYHYLFQIQGVTDDAGAKMVTDMLRPVFNTPEDPYAIFPDFNEQLGQFDFFGTVLVSEEQLQTALNPQGMLISSFSNEPVESHPEEQ